MTSSSRTLVLAVATTLVLAIAAVYLGRAVDQRPEASDPDPGTASKSPSPAVPIEPSPAQVATEPAAADRTLSSVPQPELAVASDEPHETKVAKTDDLFFDLVALEKALVAARIPNPFGGTDGPMDEATAHRLVEMVKPGFESEP